MARHVGLRPRDRHALDLYRTAAPPAFRAETRDPFRRRVGRALLRSDGRADRAGARSARRRDSRTGRSGSRRHVVLPPRIPEAPARNLLAVRRAADRRRDRDRFRPNRTDVRLGMGRHNARHSVRREGADRRLYELRRRSGDGESGRGDLVGLPSRIHARADLHGQPAGLLDRMRLALRCPASARSRASCDANWLRQRPCLR